MRRQGLFQARPDFHWALAFIDLSMVSVQNGRQQISPSGACMALSVSVQDSHFTSPFATFLRQATRHLYALAVEWRWLRCVDVDTGADVDVDVEVMCCLLVDSCLSLMACPSVEGQTLWQRRRPGSSINARSSSRVIVCGASDSVCC